MKAMSKQEIADHAGITLKTLSNWLKPYRQELEQMGMQPNMRILPPRIVQWICDKFCIDC